MSTTHLILNTSRLVLAVAAFGLCACASNEELQDRLDRRNENYSNMQDRKEMRRDARQQRTDEWFERAMN